MIFIILLIVFSTIIILHQIYYMLLFNYYKKRIKKINLKIENNKLDKDYLYLNRNYDISKMNYIYFVNFTFVVKLLFKRKLYYGYYE